MYAPACKENGTDQAEVYLMSAADFKDPIAERDREDLISSADAVIQKAIEADQPMAEALFDAGMLRKGAGDER